MDTTVQIEKFMCDLRRRNRREIILGILAIPFAIGVSRYSLILCWISLGLLLRLPVMEFTFSWRSFKGFSSYPYYSQEYRILPIRAKIAKYCGISD